MIDCDVHNDWATAEVLLPYIDRNFRDYFERGELPAPRARFHMRTGRGCTRRIFGARTSSRAIRRSITP